MIGIIILIVVCFIIAGLIVDKKEVNDKTQRLRGMRERYKILVSELLDGSPNSRIIDETNDSLTITWKGAGYTNATFILKQSFEHLIITVKMRNSNGREISKTLNYPNTLTQQQISQNLLMQLMTEFM